MQTYYHVIVAGVGYNVGLCCDNARLAGCVGCLFGGGGYAYHFFCSKPVAGEVAGCSRVRGRIRVLEGQSAQAVEWRVQTCPQLQSVSRRCCGLSAGVR